MIRENEIYNKIMKRMSSRNSCPSVEKHIFFFHTELFNEKLHVFFKEASMYWGIRYIYTVLTEEPYRWEYNITVILRK
jgi:hypothetical protein